MDLFEGLETLDPPIPRSTVAVGTFDGVHLGHRTIIETAVSDARRNGRPSVVFTFDRHPADLLYPANSPGFLTTSPQRNRLIESMGVDALVVARFDRALSLLEPDQFVTMILKADLGAESIIVGSNFCFGKGRAGDFAYLNSNQERFHYKLSALEPVELDGTPVSSTRIRECIRGGAVAEAETLLGHEYLLSGHVVHGEHLGRALGFPTANLELDIDQVVPADGIYAVRAILSDGRVVGGACSIGNRPTIPGAGRSIETYLLDFDEDLYGQPIDLRFAERVRAELKFESLDALKRQIAEDVALIRGILGRP